MRVGEKILTRYSSKDCIYRPLKMAKVQINKSLKAKFPLAQKKIIVNNVTHSNPNSGFLRACSSMVEQ